MQLDAFLFQYINGFAEHFDWLDFLAVFLADYLQYCLVVILIFILFFPEKNRLKNRIMVFLGILAAFIARFVVKTGIILFYSRPRPFILLEDARQLLNVSFNENFQSFPSGHAIFFFALSAVLYCFSKKLGAGFFIASVLMAGARVFVGVHWLSDVVVGAFLGMLVGWAVFKFYQSRSRQIREQ